MWAVDSGAVAGVQEVCLFLVLWLVACQLADWLTLPKVDLKGLIMGEGDEAGVEVDVRASTVRGMFTERSALAIAIALILYVAG
ncbi:MAG: hypothetical protein F4Y71_08455 [Acidobacteria bacterium]|nr:hypothetical protein [Acidobacteriota bacterium]